MPLCPGCMGANLRLIHRRPIDRVRSLFAPIQRFRCPVKNCRWEGNLPAVRGPAARDRNRARMLAVITVTAAVVAGVVIAEEGSRPEKPPKAKKK